MSDLEGFNIDQNKGSPYFPPKIFKMRSWGYKYTFLIFPPSAFGNLKFSLLPMIWISPILFPISSNVFVVGNLIGNTIFIPSFVQSKLWFTDKYYFKTIIHSKVYFLISMLVEDKITKNTKTDINRLILQQYNLFHVCKIIV